MRPFDAVMNEMTRRANAAQLSTAQPRYGLVTSYDPNTYAVKVLLQPEGIETGWLPIKAIWFGNGWGMFCPPSQGDQVTIDWQEGSVEAGFMTGGVFSDEDRPLPCPSGEFWLVHQSGASLKFTNSGQVTMNAQAGFIVSGIITADGLQARNGASGSFTTPTGNVVTVQDGIITNITD
jgi:phage baseplate assembly protein gpV